MYYVKLEDDVAAIRLQGSASAPRRPTASTSTGSSCPARSSRRPRRYAARHRSRSIAAICSRSARPRATRMKPLPVRTDLVARVGDRRARAQRGRAVDRRNRRAAVDKEVHRRAVDLAVDPEMPVDRHRDAHFAARRRSARPSPRSSAAGRRSRGSSRNVNRTKPGAEDRDPRQRHHRHPGRAARGDRSARRAPASSPSANTGCRA